MPIKINGDASSAEKISKQIYSAKFFSKDITGTGKATGLINTAMFPINIQATVPENSRSLYWSIRTDTNKFVKNTVYPLNPLGKYIPLYIPGGIEYNTSWCHVSQSASTAYDYCWAIMPMNIRISESLINVSVLQSDTDDDAKTTSTQTSTATSTATTGKKCAVLYCLMYIQVAKTPDKQATVLNTYFTENPLVTFDKQNPTNADRLAFIDYLNNYNVHAEICELSKIWQTTLIDKIIKAHDADPTSFPMFEIIRYIAQYKVTLAQYKDLYLALKSRFSENDIKTFTKLNTSLLLQNTLDNLSAIQFPALPAPGLTSKTLDLSWCSKEQFDAITSAAPLNQVQAGAGTGKSTVIKSRLDYLDYLGVDLNKIMVLSFTNAAADNIKARCPNIQSMTIASMIDTIYRKNHPTHQLSPSLARRGEGSTFTNSLSLYANKLPYVSELTAAVNDVERYNDYAGLLRLVEEHYDDIMTILDTIQQTTFHLEIIICYLEHATMTIPFDIEHLLIDEVQDNAIFEFIFFLNLTCKLKNHLYLVGDCSQTLYEFRASDPKALNAIENSGLFATFPLNINYRSNQNILQFANVLLDDIEANQYANIQLQAFNLCAITQQSFADAVTVDYNRIMKVSEMKDWLYTKLHNPNVRAWIDDKLAKNEQICILTYKRRDAAYIQSILEEIYKDKNFVSIIPAKNTAFAYFSHYVSHNKQQFLALPTTTATDLCNRISAEILVEITNGTKFAKTQTKILDIVKSMLLEWKTANMPVIQDIIDRFKAGAVTHQQLADKVCETLIDFEIQKNALRQSMVSQRNADKKEDTDNANFIFSTIHSAKGLEFDNVLLLYKNDNIMAEDDKRMYYVALTRAKKSEYVLAYDTTLNAVIQTRYDAVLAQLPDMNTAVTAAVS